MTKSFNSSRLWDSSQKASLAASRGEANIKRNRKLKLGDAAGGGLNLRVVDEKIEIVVASEILIENDIGIHANKFSVDNLFYNVAAASAAGAGSLPRMRGSGG